ncbi:hypothetical protein [Nesterenkonia halobia]
MSAPKRSRPAKTASKASSTSASRSASSSTSRPAGRGSGMRWARWLWAVVITVVLGALLFEFTMVWTIGVGTYMITMGELTGLWFLVAGYVLACVPPAFGLLVATGGFWRSMTHALWIGLIYGAVGFLFLDQVAGLTI